MIIKIHMKPFEICNYPKCKMRYSNGRSFPCIGMEKERDSDFYCEILDEKRGEKYVEND